MQHYHFELKILCQTIEAKAEADLFDDIAPLLKKLEAEFKIVEKTFSVKSRRNRHEDTYRG